MDWQAFYEAAKPFIEQAGNALLGLLISMAVAWLANQVRLLIPRVVAYVDNKIDAQDRQAIEDLAIKAVRMAEQYGITAKLEQFALDKKDAAFVWLKAELEKRNIPLDPDYLEGVLESAVYDQFNRTKSAAIAEGHLVPVALKAEEDGAAEVAPK